MPLKALQIGAPEWYTPARYRDDIDPVGFKVRGLTGSQQAEVSPEVTIDKDFNISFSAAGVRLLLKFGLIDWRNFVDSNGDPIEYGRLSALEVQDMLDIGDQTSLAAEIFQRSFLDADDKKKS